MPRPPRAGRVSVTLDDRLFRHLPSDIRLGGLAIGGGRPLTHPEGSLWGAACDRERMPAIWMESTGSADERMFISA